MDKKRELKALIATGYVKAKTVFVLVRRVGTKELVGTWVKTGDVNVNRALMEKTAVQFGVRHVSFEIHAETTPFAELTISIVKFQSLFIYLT